jgi:CheY-like chemotaxis protein
MLRSAGHQVIEPTDGFAATEYLESDLPFDLMLLDLAMPGLNGGDVAAVANELRPGLPVVFMTGYAETDLLQPWIAKGHRVVAKPFRSADFDEVLVELFETPATFAGSERPGPERRRLR